MVNVCATYCNIKNSAPRRTEYLFVLCNYNYMIIITINIDYFPNRSTAKEEEGQKLW
jgi:hypothetical protein